MLQEQMILYVRENVLLIVCGVSLLVLFIVFIQVTRTRREVHKICKKIRKYFDVVLSEETTETVKEKKHEDADQKVQVYQISEEERKQQEQQKKAADAKLLMDVIQEVF